MNDAPFFIVGSDRSGTTMLRLMLNEHSRLHVPRESWFITPLMNSLPSDSPLHSDQITEAFNIITSHERWNDWDISNKVLYDIFASLKNPHLSDVIEAIFRYSAKKAAKPRWGDKTPNYIQEIKRIRRIFPNAKFIHIIRDGRDVCLSLMRVKWHGDSIIDYARYWKKMVTHGIVDGRALGLENYCEIKYEDLVLNTKKVLRQICLFLGEEYQEEMTTFYKRSTDEVAPWEKNIHAKTTRPPRGSDINRWTCEMKAMQVALFEALAGDVMDQVGQKRKFMGTGKLFLIAWWILIWTAESSLPIRRRFGIHFPLLRKIFWA